MRDLELLRGQVYGNTCKGLPRLGESCPYLWGLSWLNQLIREDPPKKGWPSSLSLETELHVREKVSKDSTSVTLLPECRCNVTRPLQLLLQWLPAMVNGALQLWAFLLPQVASAQQRGKNTNNQSNTKQVFFFLKFTRSFHRFIHYCFVLLVVKSISFVTSSKLLMIINRMGGWKVSLSTAGSSALLWEPLPSLGVFQSWHL